MATRKPKKQVFLHVGAHKTASTFLQWHWFPEIKGVDYGFSCRKNDLFDIIAGTINAHDAFFDGRGERKRAEKAIAGSTFDKILVSREGLFGDLYHSYHDNPAITRRLATVVPSAKLVIVIRRQDTWLRSCYAQSLKGGNYTDYHTFINYRNGEFNIGDDHSPTLNFSVPYLDWRRYVEVYAEAFGRDNLLILPYELMRADRQAFLEKIVSFMEVGMAEPTLDKEANPSLSLASERFYRFFNRLFKDLLNPAGFIPTRPWHDVLEARREEGRLFALLASLSGRISIKYISEHYLDRIFSRRPPAEPELAKKIIGLHAESNAQLDADYDLGLKAFGYY